MKAEFDKEIDSLLRQSARRGRAVSDAPAPAAAHLDADEQSAYAENALPAAARAYYAAHLADCDDCRRSVTQLALAAGMPAQLEPRETATGHEVPANIGWRERLAALFAPRALRYAAPALALLLVGAVTFIVLTRKTREDAASVARHNTSETKPAATATQTEAHHAPQNYDAAADATPGGESAAVAPGADASTPREEIAANSPRGEVVAPVTSAPLTETAEAPPPPPAAPSSGGSVSARTAPELPTPAPTPAPVASDAVTITSDQEAKVKTAESVAELRKLEQRSGNVENRQYENRRREQISGPQRSNNEQARNARTGNAADAQNRADEKDRAATTTAAPAAAMKRSTRREPEDSERSEGAKPAETRAVAGRKFRRQGDAWVDTAFNAGESYTAVRRNSEQFRALVADEPELRRIAGALGGDVTVVWKGRAYRFR
jgi:hypothetical protein